MKANRWYIIQLMQEVELNLKSLIEQNDLGVEYSEQLKREVQDRVVKNINNIKSKKEFKNIDFLVKTYEALADTLMGA
jgi:hypothetical protein